MRRLLFVLALLTGACFAQQGNTVSITGAGAPTGSCSYIFRYIDSVAGTEYNCKAGAWNSVGGGGAGSAAFSAITAGTNSTAAMVVGTGASLAVSGTGTIAATSFGAIYSSVTYSATPTFDASLGDTFKITLTGAVTSSTFSNGVNGHIYTFIVCQDSTGGRAFVPPSQMKQYSTWTAFASNCVTQQFAYDGTNLNAIAPWTPDTRPVTAGALDDEFDAVALSGSWSYLNQGTSTSSEQNGVLRVLPQVNNGAHNIVMIKQTYPNGNHAYITKVYPQSQSGNAYGGICISDGTLYYTLMAGYNATNGPYIFFDSWTNTSSPSSVGDSQWSGATAIYFKLTDDGATTRTWQVSTNGSIYTTIKSESRTATLTATSVGLCTETTASAAFPNITFDFFREQ